VVGEQCVLLCPGGDLLQGVALAGLFSDSLSQGSTEPGVYLQEWSNTDLVRWADVSVSASHLPNPAPPPEDPVHQSLPLVDTWTL